MEFLISLFTSVVPFLILLTILVFVHELGHYLIAKHNGVKIEAFAIGFGSEIFGWNDKHGTRWKFCAIPLGGYVKMFADANAASQADGEKLQQLSEEERQQTLHAKSVWQRIAVAAGGPLANYAFAIVLFAGVFAVQGQMAISEKAKVGMVAENSAAEAAGLQKDDVIFNLQLI